jgi:hypothetical protein
MFNNEIGWPQVGDVVRFTRVNVLDWVVVLILENPNVTSTGSRPYWVFHIEGIDKGRKQPFWIQPDDPRFELVAAVDATPKEETP